MNTTEFTRENLRLTQVAYGDGGTSDELSRQIVTNVSTYVAGQDWSRQGEFPHDVFISRDFILPWVANFKHESFREEREWRMVVVDPPAVSNFRAGPNGVTPFFETRHSNWCDYGRGYWAKYEPGSYRAGT